MLPPAALSRLKNRIRSRSRSRARLQGREVLRQGSVHDRRLEERCLMTGGIEFPGPFVDSLSKVFYDGVTSQYAKTITITNNSNATIYPFLEGENSRPGVAPYGGTAAFDPYDSINQEYRGYIGYTEGQTSYVGLQPHSAITVTVPLVFWDSGRLIISTDGADQFSTYGGPDSGTPTGQPFNFFNTDAFARYMGSVQTVGGQTVLQFAPAYNSFDATPQHKPTTANWQSPVASGELPAVSPGTTDKQMYVVTGKGLPAGGELVTLDPGQPGYVVLPQGGTAAGLDQYVFKAVTSDPAHNDMPIFTTARYVQTSVPLTVTTNGVPAPTTTGAVMWYHDLNANAPNNVAPFQLTEFTFRGEFYNKAVNVGTGFDWLLDGNDTHDPLGVYASSIHDIADYDISFVDTISLPVAMEATGVTISGTSSQAPFGWVGSSQTIDDFQKALQDFTSTNAPGTNTNFLGQYFDGKGYPSYNVIQEGSLKLPAAQNVFFSSPLVQGVSSIQFYMKFSDGSIIKAPMYALSTGGTGPSQIGIGGSEDFVKTGGKNLGLATLGNLANQYALSNFIGKNLAPGPDQQLWNVYDNNKQLNLGPVASIIYQDVQGKTIPVGVTLKNSLPSGVSPLDSFQFTPVLTDYAATRIASLWYSWAKYYADNVKSTPVNNLAGTIGTGKNNNILTLTNPPSGLTLVPGMSVTGTNVPAGCVILSVSPDNKTIALSGVVAPGVNATFSFARPDFASIPGYNQLTPITFDFSKDTPQEKAAALPFAQTVFTVMSAWSVSVPSGKPLVWDPLMINIIGGNLNNEYIPAGNENVQNALTILSKSALRGVPNYTSPLYSDPSQWYPDPALAKGGQEYNVFNLNPFVWFIHQKLGLNAYAFALDDDIGNVEAGGSTNFDVNVGGLAGLPDPSDPSRMTLPNKDPYATTSQWGVVTTTATAPGPKSSVLGNLSNPNIGAQLKVYNDAHHAVGTLVNGPGVPSGTTVQYTPIDNSAPQTNSIVLTAPVSTAPPNAPYAFFGQLVFTATVLGPGQSPNTLILTDKDAAGTLKKIGPLTNIRVTGEGIDPSKPPVTVTGMTTDGNGVTTITLSSPLVNALVSTPGTYYAYTFGTPTIDVVRNGGFEYRVVGNVDGNFLHGAQIRPPDQWATVDDWTYFDSPTNPQNWFAGIAIAPGSQYAGTQQTAPQGLQVGFLQGNSAIIQPVVLAQGTYSLSLMAAQSAMNQPGQLQSLGVMVDGQVVQILKPAGTNFTQFNNVTFTVGPGDHRIRLQGVELNDSTVLVDSVVCKAVPSSLIQSPPPPRSAALKLGKAVTQGAELLDAGSVVGDSSQSFVATVDYGDGTGLHRLPLNATGSFVLDHVYTRPGTYTAVVDVSDGHGDFETAKIAVTAAAGPPLVSGFGTARDAFVATLYRENLGRVPDLNTLKSLSRRLAAGADPSSVALAVWNSPEHRTLVKERLVAPLSFRQAYLDALRAAQLAARLHRPPAGPLTLKVNSQSS